ncbi:MAG: hypothetical protein M1812_006379 [Candelaria pacifica]|nr:MAG: hypothetical protein M1812_006379 [Candelaria pacifica]
MSDMQASANQGKQSKLASIQVAVANPALQCDETKPVCQRCTKSRRICVEASAAKQACFSIHVENQYASGSTKRPRGPRSSLTVLRPQFDLKTRALTYYLQCHIYTLADMPNVSESLSECVCAWRASGKTCSMVDLAVSSMALAVYARTQHHPLAIKEAFSTYHQLLGVVQKRILNGETLKTDEKITDAFLLAILLMGRYEGVMHQCNHVKSKDSFQSFQSWSHHDGAMAILKAWNDRHKRSPATLIIKQIRRGLIRSSLMRHKPLPEWMLDSNRFGENGKCYDSLVTRAVHLHHAMLKLREGSSCHHTARAAELDAELRELDEALEDWVARFPGTWAYRRHALTAGPWPRKHFYSSVAFSYSTLGYGAAWSRYFAMRMLINSTRWRVLRFSRPELLAISLCEQQQLECVTQLSTMADNLASTIPFCLDRFKVPGSTGSSSRQSQITLNTKEDVKPHLATLVVWPLTIASSLEGIHVGLQLWFRSELATLGRIVGARVLECAATADWAAL